VLCKRKIIFACAKQYAEEYDAPRCLVHSIGPKYLPGIWEYHRKQGAVHGAAASQPTTADDGSVPVAPSGHVDAWTKFRYVCRQSSGKFEARISRAKAERWLGTFCVDGGPHDLAGIWKNHVF
jgi:hypothetical protein